WAEPVTISFDLDGGQYMHGDPSLVFPRGFTYQLPWPGDFFKDGYVLSGWRDTAGREYENHGWVVVNEDTTFTALWAEPVTLSFDANGGNWRHEDPSTDIPIGSIWRLPGRHEISKEGYALAFWRDTASEVDYPPEDEIVANQDRSFIAVWVEAVTIRFETDGGGWLHDEISFALPHGERFWLPNHFDIAKENYALAYWRDTAGNKDYLPGEELLATVDMTFVAIWAEPVTISFDLDGGQYMHGNPSHVFPRGFTYQLPWPGDFFKEGYVLSGWRDAAGREYENNGWVVVNEDTTFTALWAEPVTLSFDANGGTWRHGDPTTDIPIGSFWRLPGRHEISKEGYALAFWRDTASNEEYLPEEEIVADQDRSFIAVWVEAVTIRFEKDGGEWTEGEGLFALPHGARFWLPDRYTIVKENYALAYWRDTASQRDYLPGEEMRATADMTFTPVWTEPVSIRFELDGGQWLYRDPSLLFPRGLTYQLPRHSDFFKAGYVLRGWRDTAGREYESDSRVVVNEDMTFTALWAEPVTLSFDKNGGTWTYGDHSGDIPIGSFWRLPGRHEISKEGYALASWRDTESQEEYPPEEEIVANQNRSFIAVWVEAVTIRFETDGGDWTEGEGVLAIPHGERFWLPYYHAIVKENCALACWRDMENNRDYQPGEEMIATADRTFTAVWTEPVSIRFELDGGQWLYRDPSLLFPRGFTYQLPWRGEFFKEGYVLSGWRDTAGREYESDSQVVVNEDTTFTALWAEPVTLSFDANGGTWTYEDATGDVPIDSFWRLPGRHEISKEGYALAFWRDTVSNEEYPPEEVIMADQNRSFIAVWVEAVTLRFEAEGGEWIHGGSTYALPRGEIFWLPYHNTIAKEGCALACWRDTASNQEYLPGDEIVATEDMTFMAVWTEPVNIRFDLNGGQWMYGDPSLVYPKGSMYILPWQEEFFKEGYVLGGWKDDEDLLYAPNVAINANRDITFTAIWITEELEIAVFRAGWSDTYELGQTINLAARGEGGIGPYKYQFYVLRSNGARVNFRKTPVSANIYPWTPVTPDTYTLGVDVYDATGHKVWQEKQITVKVPDTPPLSIAVFRAGWSDTYELGQKIDLAARGEGGTEPYKYQFYVLRSNGSRVNFRKTPVSANIYPWTPVTPDTYTLGVDVYDAKGVKVTREKTITVKAPDTPPLSIAVFRAGWSDTYELGQTIDLAARGKDGTGPYKYQFYVLRSNGSRVNFRKTPVSSNIYPWTPVTPDTYTLGVDVYDAKGVKVTQTKIIKVLPKP
ncbi:MAG: InlB B-repeat-containing protein, partial [Bacillota bacterium]|nr:InlB B-repeat-containing protein [Bacillota bacterium]